MNSYKNSSQSVKSIIELYTKIPDYSALKHLGNSEFIYKIEKLKEEFREIRSSLTKEEDDLDSVVESSVKRLHVTKDVHTGLSSLGIYGRSAASKYTEKRTNPRKDEPVSSSLAVSSCEIHQPLGMTLRNVANYHRPIRRGRSISPSSLSTLSHQSNLCPHPKKWTPQNDPSQTSSSSVSLSHWSSSPEISTFRKKEYSPPQNIEKRLIRRKTQNKNDNDFVRNKKEDSSVSNLKPSNRVLRIPSAVTKPLFDQIVEKNKKRSRKVREQSKQKLMAQVKPFSFSKSTLGMHGFKSQTPDTSLPLNNSKQEMKSKNVYLKHSKHLKVHRNSLQEGQTFKANPAPPRSRALMSALRLKEQQEYRELKKQLRSEALMRLSSLPPGMASRNSAKYKSPKVETPDGGYGEHGRKNWNRKIVENTEDEHSTCTDEDRVSEASFAENGNNPPPAENSNPSSAEKIKYKKSPNGSYTTGLSRILKGSKNVGVFESTSNDNVASRLRIEAAKKKEDARIKREQEEYAKLKKTDEKRYKLRSFHSDVWRRACSYSSNQDIAMRRQLRMAEAILENDSFRREMSTMLSRVQSAPLLLQGIRERHCEPCKKHQQEIQMSARSPAKFKLNILKSPTTLRKYLSRRNWTSTGEDEQLAGGVTGEGCSETLAMAEGSLTNSDNEWGNEAELEEDKSLGRKRSDESANDEAAKIEQEADDIIGGDQIEDEF